MWIKATFVFLLQVKIWFQNRRAKERKINKKKLQQPASSTTTPTPPGGTNGGSSGLLGSNGSGAAMVTSSSSSNGLVSPSLALNIKEEYWGGYLFFLDDGGGKSDLKFSATNWKKNLLLPALVLLKLKLVKYLGDAWGDCSSPPSDCCCRRFPRKFSLSRLFSGGERLNLNCFQLPDQLKPSAQAPYEVYVR